MVEREPREMCFRCAKPKDTCVCRFITQVDNRTQITVLQHPRERDHPIGTARFVELGLSRSKVHIAYELSTRPPLPERSGLLFPRDDARDLESLAPKEHPENLVILDGTWPQARSLYRRNPWLKDLPHFRLSPSAPSRYRIRREPSPDYVSTLESVVIALQILEPEIEGLESLLNAFDEMVDMQIRKRDVAIGRGAPRRRKVYATPRQYRGVPRWFGEQFDELVGIYAEAIPASGAPVEDRELVQVVGLSFATGNVFEGFTLPPSGLPSTQALLPLGLSQGNFEHAVNAKVLFQQLSEFIGEGRCIAWNASTPSLLHAASGHSMSVRYLRSVLRSLDARYPGVRFTPPPLDQSQSRAMQRLFNLRSRAKHILQRAKRRDNALCD